MLKRNVKRWGLLSLLVALGALALALASSGTAAAQKCRSVTGDFTLTPVSGPSCSSPVGICATGVSRGVIKGTSTFTASSLIPTVDTPTTGVVFVTGDNLFTTDNGTLTTKSGIVLHTTGAGEFAELETVVGGTGEWSGASGGFSVTGTFTPSGGGSGRYSGEVCTP